MSIVVYMDNREKDTRLKQFKNFCQEHNLTRIMKPEQLPVGDYIFKDTETGISVCFEYKTVTDFISSIMDNRVKNQAINMAEKYADNYVVIVGDYSKESKKLYQKGYLTNFTKSNYLGGYNSIMGISRVIIADNMSNAFDLMLRRSISVFKGETVYRRDSRLPKGAGQYLVCTVPGVGPKLATVIVEELGLERVSDLIKVKREDLVSVRGVSEKRADKIMEVIK